MTNKKVWLITGAGRGMGVDIAKAALATGHNDLLSLKLDVTRPEDARAAVDAAVGKFGRIDVLVNNARNFYAGFFEELSPEQVRNQIETLLFGPMSAVRVVPRLTPGAFLA